MTRRFISHQRPAWANRANFYIHADLEEDGMRDSSEQLAVRRIGDDRFELCCLPFFSYGYSLGDVVSASEKSDGRIVLDEIQEDNGGHLFRLAFTDKDDAALYCDLVAQVLEQAGLIVEWNGDGYAAVFYQEPDELREIERLLESWSALMVQEIAK